MKESDYEQLSKKDNMSRTQKHKQRHSEDIENLQLADEHIIKSKGFNKSEVEETSKGSPILKTLFWILRKLIAPIVMVAMLATGLYIGYVVVAGQSSDEVFKFETWSHLWNLIFADS